MTAFLAALSVVVSFGAAASSVEGQILDPSGNPISGARVFMEQGLGAPLIETESDSGGHYRFENTLAVPTGFFAVAPGYAFGGRSHRLRIDDTLTKFDITLAPSGSVSGLIHTGNEQPLKNAYVTRVALESRKVSIPFFKLREHGFSMPTSDAKGRFQIPALPEDEDLVLKIAHSSYAQMAKDGVRVGDSKVSVRMRPGVLLNGTVTARGSESPIPNMPILFTSSSSPPSTSIAMSGFKGTYTIRLLPGSYTVRSEGTTFRSQNLEQIELTEDHPNLRFDVRVAGSALIRGQVIDAKDESPVSGARLQLSSQGAPVARTVTGPTGEYTFDAAAGENSIELLSAPGYITPPGQGYRVLVDTGDVESVPTIWLARIPKYVLRVFDPDEQSVSGAFVSVIRPRQIGWRITNAEGTVELDFAQLPADGNVVGYVEHPTKPLGAVFSIERKRASDATVQLLPLTSLEGTVQDDEGRPLEGVAVEGLLMGTKEGDFSPLWSTFTDGDGEYRWPAVVPHSALTVAAFAQNKDGAPQSGEIPPFVVEREGVYPVAPITLDSVEEGKSLLGKTLKLADFDLLPGASAIRDALPRVVFFGRSIHADAVIDSAENAAMHLSGRNFEIIVVLDAPVTIESAAVPVLSGRNPGSASTYVCDAAGTVVFETAGLPPLRALADLATAGE